jgi:uncharacterized protein
MNDCDPVLCILVHVEETLYHCAKATIRPGMWWQETWGSVEGVPTYAETLIADGKLARTIKDMEAVAAPTKLTDSPNGR